MTLSFRTMVVTIALATTVSAAQNEKADEKTVDPKDAMALLAMMMQIQQSITSVAGGGNVDENTRSVVKQLVVFPMEKLYFLKMSDTCDVAGFSCGKFNADKVRPLIDIELDRRKAILDQADKQRSFYLSLGSLIVSCCALALSVFGISRRPHRSMET
jgi:hypothetical protein